MVFPKTYVCHNYQHSRVKLQNVYPNLTDNALAFLYGRYDTEKATAWWSNNTWLNSIDLQSFFSNTRPEYHVTVCMYDHKSCLERECNFIYLLFGRPFIIFHLFFLFIKSCFWTELFWPSNWPKKG